MEQRRPTGLGCLVENVRSLTMIVSLAIIGAFIGQAISPDGGAYSGFVTGAVVAMVVPWRRWWRQWLEGRFKKKE